MLQDNSQNDLLREEQENQQLTHDLHTLYDTDRTRTEDAQSLARIRARLQQRTAMPVSQIDDARLDNMPVQQSLEAPEEREKELPHATRRRLSAWRNSHRHWTRSVSEIAALIIVTALVGSLVLVFALRPHAPGHSGVPSINANGQVQEIHMMDAKTGWAIVQSRHNNMPDPAPALMRTSDGGQTWYDVTPPEPYNISTGPLANGTPTPSPNDGVVVWAASFQTDFLSGNDAWVALIPSASGATPLAFTHDGGQTWHESSIPTSNITQMTFIDAQHGWVLSSLSSAPNNSDIDNAILLQTTDGGITWTHVLQATSSRPLSDTSVGPLPAAGIKTGFTFINPQTGWMVGTTPYKNFFWFYVTHDGGKTWQHQDMPPLQRPIPPSPNGAGPQFQLSPPSFFGNEGVLSFTIPTDGRYPTTPESASGLILEFYVSHDGGNTWHSVQSPFVFATSSNFYHAFRMPQMLDATHGVATLGNQVLFIGTYNGNFVMSSFSDTLSTKYRNSGNIVQYSFISPTRGWVVLDNAHPLSTGVTSNDPLLLYQTTDGGQTWTQIHYAITGQHVHTSEKLGMGWSAIASYSSSGSKVMFLHGDLIAPGNWGVIASCSGNGTFTAIPLVIDAATHTTSTTGVSGLTVGTCGADMNIADATNPSTNQSLKTIVPTGIQVEAPDAVNWTVTIARCTLSRGCSSTPLAS